jgi:serine/threonine protein kinase
MKVLDFGLAKLVESTEADTQAQTRMMIDTGAGVVMGTARYMSPEQAEGLKVDARSDIWSLGVVMYEMVTGQAPFSATTNPETLSLVLRKQPAPINLYRDGVPAELERIIAKALTKDREERYQTSKDLLIDLRNLSAKLKWTLKSIAAFPQHNEPYRHRTPTRQPILCTQLPARNTSSPASSVTSSLQL